MENTDHHLLSGQGAQDFARDMGFTIEDDLNTDYSRYVWEEWKNRVEPEQYLDPSRRGPLRFLRLEAERLAPSPDCTTVAANTFGEFGLKIWAQERGLRSAEAAALAEGWDADRAVVFDCRQDRAFAWLMQFETEARARQFAEVARRVSRSSTRVDEWGTRVLLWANLTRGGREVALLETESEIYRDLRQYLAARPEILERARALHDRISVERGERDGHHPAETGGGEREGDL